MQESPGMNGNLVAFIDVRRLELYLTPMLLKETNIFLRSQRTYMYRTINYSGGYGSNLKLALFPTKQQLFPKHFHFWNTFLGTHISTVRASSMVRKYLYCQKSHEIFEMP